LVSEIDTINHLVHFNVKVGWVLLIYFFPVSEPTISQQQNTGHHTMEFFEMCAALITQLAR
jgi:hypothetical protein